MPQPLAAGLIEDLELDAGYRIRVVALDPSTGAIVTGVTLADVTFMVRDLGAAADEDLSPAPLLVPASEQAG